MKLKLGNTYNLRILPPTWDDPEHYGIDLYTHHSIGSDNSTIVCINKMLGKKCPICEAIIAAGDDKEYAKKLRARRRTLVWVIDRKDKETDMPKLFIMPVEKLDNEILRHARSKKTGKVRKIDRIEDGHDIYFDTVKSEMKEIPYTYGGVEVDGEESSIANSPDKIEEIIQFIIDNPLPSVLNYKNYDEIKTIFEGGIVESKEDDDIPLEPKSSKSYVNINKEEVEEKVIDKPKEVEKEGVEETSYTYEELNECDEDDLRALAVDEFGMKKIKAKILDKDELLEYICEAAEIKIPKKEEESKPSALSKMEEARERIKKLREKTGK
jgi:hypothetical protein